MLNSVSTHLENHQVALTEPPMNCASYIIVLTGFMEQLWVSNKAVLMTKTGHAMFRVLSKHHLTPASWNLGSKSICTDVLETLS